jgi:hypothetical protein
VTDRIALYLGLVIVALCALDLVANGGGVLFFLARKLFVFVEYLAFWR